MTAATGVASKRSDGERVGTGQDRGGAMAGDDDVTDVGGRHGSTTRAGCAGDADTALQVETEISAVIVYECGLE